MSRQQCPPYFEVYWAFLRHYLSTDNDSTCPLYDKLAWGYWDKEREDPVRTYTKEYRNRFLLDAAMAKRHPNYQRGWFCSSFRKSDLYEHVCNNGSLYYVNNRRHNRPLICIDIDGHYPNQRPQDALDFLRSSYTDLYWEPSRSGTGFHAYMFLNMPFTSREKINNKIDEILLALKRLAGPELSPTIDTIVGNYPLTEEVTEDGVIYHAYVNDGRQGQFPRLTKGCINKALIQELRETGIESDSKRINRIIDQYIRPHWDDLGIQRAVSLIGTTVLTEEDLNGLMDLAELSGNEEVHASQDSKEKEQGSSADQGSIYTGYTTCGSLWTNKGANSSTGEKTAELIDSPNSLKRKRGVWLRLLRELKRPPSEEEYLSHYEQHYTRNPRKKDKSRRRELRRIHKYMVRNCHVRQAAKFREDDYAWIREHEQELNSKRSCRHRIPPELAMVVVFLAEHPAGSWYGHRFTLPLERVRSMVKLLNKEGIVPMRSLQNYQISETKRLCAEYGWIEQIDMYCRPAGPHRDGIGAKYIPGPKHPRRDAFMKRYGDGVKKAKNQMKSQLIKANAAS